MASKERNDKESTDNWGYFKDNKFRIVLFCVSIILASIILIVWQTGSMKETTIDFGGIASLLGLAGLIFLLKLDQEITVTIRKSYNYSPSGIVILFFLIAGFVALWFTIRTLGLTLEQSLMFSTPQGTTNLFSYTTSKIFLILGYLLAANLCFSLAKTFREIDEDSKTRIKINSDDSQDGSLDPVPKLFSAVIQAIIIGMITLIPRYGDSSLLDLFGNNDSSLGIILYVIVIITFVISLLMLVRFRKNVFPSQDKGK